MSNLETKICSNKSKNSAALWVAKTGILTAVAILLMYMELSLPLMPVFLKFDFSETAVLLAAFTLGPWTAVLVEFLKNVAHLPVTATGGVGELANFIIGSAFVLTAGLYYRAHKNKKGAYLAMGLGTLAMTALAVVMNYFILIPFYVTVLSLPMDLIIEWSQAAGNSLVTDLKTLIAFAFVPFNLFKGLIVSVLVALLYKRLSGVLHK